MNRSSRAASVVSLVAIALLQLWSAPASAAEAASTFSAATSSATLGHDGPFDDGPGRFTNVRVELHLDFGWYGAAGVGGRVEFSVAHDLVNGVDNDLAVSLGADVFYFYTPRLLGLGVYPIAAVQWNFYLNRRISLFPELGVAFLFGPSRDLYWATFVAPYVGFGLRVHFTDRNALLFRINWPAGLQVGITF